MNILSHLIAFLLLPVLLLGSTPVSALALLASFEGTFPFAKRATGNLLSIGTDTPDGASATYTYDVLNRLESVTDTNAQQTGYGYDAAGNLGNVATANGVVHSYSYNGLNRLTGLTVSKALAVLANYDYTLYATGQRRSAAETGAGLQPSAPAAVRTRVWSYDTLWRLTNETLAGAPTAAQNRSVTYTHDAVGNRLTRASSLTGLAGQSFGYDANDRVTGDTYDANGNTKQGSASQLSTLNAQPLPSTDTYDTQNRLVARTGATGSVQVVYDGDGHKVRETVTRDGLTTVTTYLVDELNPTGYAQVIEEKTNGTLTRVYTYGHDLISQDAFYGGDWHLAAYAYDGHGSVRFLTNSLGQVTDTYDYDAFGSLLATAGATPNNYLYCGEQLDGALGLYYLRARMMNPLTGRFWSADSFEGAKRDPASLHKYLYCGADAANCIDPSGHMGMAEVMTATANSLIVVGAAAIAYTEYRTHALSNATILLAKAALSKITGAFAGTTAAATLTYEEARVRPQEAIDALRIRSRLSLIFLHGTSSNAWLELGASASDVQIDGERGGGDFGTGFYTFNGLDPFGVLSTIEWAKAVAKGDDGIPLIGVFGVDSDDYQRLTKLPVPPGTKPLLNGLGLTGFDVVIGPLSGTAGKLYSDQYKFEGRGIESLRFLGAIPLPK